MRRFGAIVVGIAALVGAASSAPAVATPAGVVPTDCGNGATVQGGHLVNVTSRNVSCPAAKRFAFDFATKSGEETGFRCSEDFYCMWRGYTCRNDGRRQPFVDHRCVNGSKVVRWQSYFSSQFRTVDLDRDGGGERVVVFSRRNDDREVLQIGPGAEAQVVAIAESPGSSRFDPIVFMPDLDATGAAVLWRVIDGNGGAPRQRAGLVTWSHARLTTRWRWTPAFGNSNLSRLRPRGRNLEVIENLYAARDSFCCPSRRVIRQFVPRGLKLREQVGRRRIVGTG